MTKTDERKFKSHMLGKKGHWNSVSKEIGVSHTWLVNYMRSNSKPNLTQKTVQKIEIYIAQNINI